MVSHAPFCQYLLHGHLLGELNLFEQDVGKHVIFKHNRLQSFASQLVSYSSSASINPKNFDEAFFIVALFSPGIYPFQLMRFRIIIG
jgi:hypothetical protein